MCTYIKKTINIPSILEQILISLKEIGVNPILVGGCVRDSLLNIPCKDYDIELFNIEKIEDIETILNKFGSVKLVGKSFGVLTLKVDGYDFDFALARVEKKIGLGHRGFKVTTKKDLSFSEASLRRDFTINSLGYDFFEKKVLDPNEGLKDLGKKVLRHIKDESFVEDPLRVYRALQFCARFELKLDESTKELCIGIKQTLLELPKSRVYEEFKKLFLKSQKPSIGLSLLKELEILEYYPELEALNNCLQEYEYHPEGDVWVHTLMVVDEMVKLKTGDEKTDMILFLACLCHDLGKPLCTKIINTKITSHKHEKLGIEPTISFLSKITDEKEIFDRVIPLVETHLSPFALYKDQSSSKAVKRLAMRVNIEELCIVALADCLGRDIQDKDKCTKAVEWLRQKAQELEVSTQALAPIVQGRDLIALGFKPSKEFKEILDYGYSLQIDDDMPKEQIISNIKQKYKI